jgi:serine/threonine protein kinase
MPINIIIGQKLYNGRYEVKSYIGPGGMSNVYEGFDVDVKRKVAIKVLKPEFSESPYWVRIFNEEAITAVQCDHPHIVKIYDRKSEGNLHYIVMQLLPIGLKTVLKKEKVLSPIRTVTILRDIAEALVYVHQKNIVHKDIKTGNIMFDDHNNAILTDFGIAISDDSTRMAGPTSAGTPGYMPPEQFKGEIVDFRSDIYSLGIVFYELITGRRPYEAEDDYAVLYKQVNEPLPEQPLNDNQIPRRIRNILDKCLAKSPDGRYQSTQELVEAFDDIIKNPPTPKPIRIRRRFNPAVLIPIVIVVAIAVYFLIKSVIGNVNGDGQEGQTHRVTVNHSSLVAKISLHLLDADVNKPVPYPGSFGKIKFHSPNYDKTIAISDSNPTFELDTNLSSNSEVSDNNSIYKLYLPQQDIGSMITLTNKIDYYEPNSLKIHITPNKVNIDTILYFSPIANGCSQCPALFKYGDTICKECGAKREK